VALFSLESSSNEEMEFERVRFRELGCGCSDKPIASLHILGVCRVQTMSTMSTMKIRGIHTQESHVTELIPAC
jgi:hypothetical protein